MRALHGVGRLTYLVVGEDGANYAQAETIQRDSLQLAQFLGDRQGIADALTDLGMVYRMQGRFLRSAEMLSEALDIYHSLSDAPGAALAMLNLGATVWNLDETNRALNLVSESFNHLEQLGDVNTLAKAQILWSQIALSQGDIGTAFRLGVAAMEAHARLGDRWFIAFDLMGLANAAREARRTQQAVELFAAAQAIAESIGSVIGDVSFGPLIETIDSARRETWFDQV